MNKPTLTPREQQVVDAVVRDTGKTIDALAGDNDSWTDVYRIALLTQLSVPTVRGLTGTLTQKGVMGTEPSQSRAGENDLYLTNAYLEAVTE